MQRYVIIGLAAALAVMVFLYQGASSDLDAARVELAAVQEANRVNQAAIEFMERSIKNTDDVLAAWNTDRTTLAQVRAETRKAIKESMQDETFKAWAAGLAPADVWRVLGDPIDTDRDSAAGATGGAFGGLPRDADSSRWKQ